MNTNGLSAIAALALCLALCSQAHAAFGGQPPLGPKDSLRQLLAPYDLIKLNYLGMNYCENLLDIRTNITSYTHLGFDSPASDAWHLDFPDDTARLLEGIAWEDQFSPVVRLELARRLAKGLVATHYPGTKGYYSFRHRAAGKTFLIFDQAEKSDGRVTISDWGDDIQGMFRVGFRARKGSEWLEIDKFSHADDPKDAGNPGLARSARYWNESPFVFSRSFTLDGTKVDFTGRYWFSDEDMPIECGFKSDTVDEMQIVVGEPGAPMKLLGDSPGTIMLPDRRTTFTSTNGDKVFEKPAFNFLVLRKESAWGCPGYSAAVLVMWEGRPDTVEALAENGYGQIRVSYGKRGGKVWLLPFRWVDRSDLTYLFRNAESFLKHGKLILNGFPTQQLVNAIPTGLAAAAYLLTKYHDPFAPTARAHAEAAADQILENQARDMTFARSFFQVRMCAWMLKTANELGDKTMAARYASALAKYVDNLLSSKTGYDGKGWPGGWDHFNSAKSVWLAYDATGNEAYLKAFERALEVYTVDEKTIYRYGKPMDNPGGFETYFGSMPMGVWGVAGKLDFIDKLIKLPALDKLWNDAGAGPWAQDDANPEYVGLSLKAANIPQKEKHILPIGAFPTYDAAGNVTITGQPIVINPFFPIPTDKAQVLKPNELPKHQISTLTFKPGYANDKKHLVSRSKGSVTYRFDTKGDVGAGVDFAISGDGYRIEVSPDGKRWFTRLDTWNDKPMNRSVDLSSLTGCRDEMIKLLTITPPDDAAYLQSGGKSGITREHCRAGEFVYKLDLRGVTESSLELVLGSGCRVECSSDGKTWREELAATPGEPDAAWVRLIDANNYLKHGPNLYLRFTGENAFLRRLAVSGIMDSNQVFVRVSNVEDSVPHKFRLDKITFRKWAK